MATRKRSAHARTSSSESVPADPGEIGRPVGRKRKASGSNLPDPASDEFAFLVAQLAWRDGLTANTIVRRLGLETSPLHLMQVKRALRRAHGCFLKLVPPVAANLRDELVDRVNRRDHPKNPIRFHVVDDRRGQPYGPVCAYAAGLASELILEAARHEPEARDPDVVICNAGGRTVSEMVRALRRSPPLVDEPEEGGDQLSSRLLFVAGNAAYLPDQFHSSANFLSVTMAELFGARHLALPKVEDAGFPTQYQALVDRASLFICGVGTKDTGLMSKYFLNRGWEFPERAVGDLAFNLLDKQGNPVETPESAHAFMREVNPAMDLTMLMHIAAKNRVLLVLDADKPAAKTAISVAALRREYATDVVLGSRLAREILRVY